MLNTNTGQVFLPPLEAAARSPLLLLFLPITPVSTSDIYIICIADNCLGAQLKDNMKLCFVLVRVFFFKILNTSDPHWAV